MEQNIYLDNLKNRNADLYIYFMRGLDILSRLNEKMFEAYFVGGVVRDFLMNVDFTDIDIATTATPEQVQAIYPDADMRYASAGCVTIKEGPMIFEITTFRTEEYAKSRKLKAVHYSQKLSEDVLRRDYTVNAMALPYSLEIIDLLGGIKDLQQKKVRIIGKGSRRYKEDPLRILRGLDLVARYNFKISLMTKLAIITSRKEVEHISTLHLTKELSKIMEAPYGKKTYRYMKNLKVFKTMPAYYKWIKKLNAHYNNLNMLEAFTLLFIYNDYTIPTNTCFDHDFLKEVKELMAISKAISLSPVNPMTIFNYGIEKIRSANYLDTIWVDKYKNQKKLIKKLYRKLPIKKRSELMITSSELIELLGGERSSRVTEIMDVLISKVVMGTIYNSREALRQEAIKMISEEVRTPVELDETHHEPKVEPVVTETFTKEEVVEEGHPIDNSLEETNLIHAFEDDVNQLYRIYLRAVEDYDELSPEEQLAIQEETKTKARNTVINGNRKYQKLHERGKI